MVYLETVPKVESTQKEFQISSFHKGKKKKNKAHIQLFQLADQKYTFVFAGWTRKRSFPPSSVLEDEVLQGEASCFLLMMNKAEEWLAHGRLPRLCTSTLQKPARVTQNSSKAQHASGLALTVLSRSSYSACCTKELYHECSRPCLMVYLKQRCAGNYSALEWAFLVADPESV